jgi:hypothetical protein
VYDLEACISRSETVSSIIFDYDEENRFQNQDVLHMVRTQAHSHTANLVVFRNVFDDDSEQIFFGHDCLERFIEFLLISNQGRNVAIAHNGSGYDTRLIFDAAIRLNLPYEMKPIRRGSKIMELRLKDVRYYFY